MTRAFSVRDLQGAWVGNCVQGIFDGQEMIRGQIVLHTMGIHGIPIVNVENACASSATALNAAWAQVALGEIDVALVLGMEKMFSEDKAKSFKIFTAAMDVERLSGISAAMKQDEEKSAQERKDGGEQTRAKTGDRSIFMDLYAMGARNHMKKYGTTQRQLAVVASKNHFHSSMNPLASVPADIYRGRGFKRCRSRLSSDQTHVFPHWRWRGSLHYLLG